MQMLCQHILIALASWAALLAATLSASATFLTTSTYRAPSVTMLTTSPIFFALFYQASELSVPVVWKPSNKHKEEKRRGKKTKLIPLLILPLPATDEPKKEVIATLF